MPLDPDIARIVSALPPMPPLDTVDLNALRARINETSANAPKLDVALAGIADRRIPGAAGDIGVRLYTPPGVGPHPLLVYYHGGGFVLGNLDIVENICRGVSAGGACVVMSVDYRLAPEHPFPAAPDDAWAAFTWARAHTSELNVDPTRIAVGGDSAGGTLAASIAIKARDAGVPLAAQVMLYGTADHPDPTTESAREFGNGPLLRSADSDFYWRCYLSSPTDRNNPMACAARAASHKNLAPAYIVTAECDPARDLGERYAAILRAAGTPVTARRYPGMPHGFLAFVAVLPKVRTAIEDLCGWLGREWAKSDQTRKRERA